MSLAAPRFIERREHVGKRIADRRMFQVRSRLGAPSATAQARVNVQLEL
jgi:hypothetical protein